MEINHELAVTEAKLNEAKSEIELQKKDYDNKIARLKQRLDEALSKLSNQL